MAASGRPGAVLLGMPGDMIHESDMVTHYVTKVGGSPWYPHTESEAPENPKCDICGQQLSLVLQANTPLISLGIQERCLYLFGCVKQGCGRSAGSWKVIRSQVRQISEEVSGVAQDSCTTINCKPGTSGQAFDDESLDVLNGKSVVENGGQEPRSPFDFADIGAKLDSLASQSTTSLAIGRKKRKQRGKKAAEVSMKSCSVVCEKPLPEFYLWSQCEPKAKSQSFSGREKEHIKDLLQKYDQMMDPVNVDKSGPPCPSKPPKGHSWDKEEYEGSSLDIKAFKAFQKYIERCPQQCVRYGFGANNICPKKDQHSIPPCQICGGRRVFELQTMPPLLSYISEAAEWSAEAGDRNRCGNAACALDAWNWMSVAVFTCRQSCNPTENGSNHVMEHVGVYEED